MNRNTRVEVVSRAKLFSPLLVSEGSASKAIGFYIYWNEKKTQIIFIQTAHVIEKVVSDYLQQATIPES